jgi:MYXO-CTERM domain-containing protein
VTSVPTIPEFNSTTYQLPSATLSAGGASSSARAGIGWVNESNFSGLAFATGTNLTQRGNTNTSAATASSLQIDFDATFFIEAGLESATAGGNFGLTGSIPTGGAAFTSVTLIANFEYTFGTSPMSLRGPISPSPFFFRSTAGTFTFSGRDIVSTTPGTLSPGGSIRMFGSLIIRVHNDNDEASVELTEGGVLGGDNIPAPGAAGLLGLMGLAATRRRRR